MLGRYPDSCDLRFGLGSIYFNCGNLPAAKEQYQTILKHDGQFRHAQRQLALLAFQEDSQDELKHWLRESKPQEGHDMVLELL
jgi:Tfp pilus assembly protein PilF